MPNNKEDLLMRLTSAMEDKTLEIERSSTNYNDSTMFTNFYLETPRKVRAHWAKIIYGNLMNKTPTIYVLYCSNGSIEESLIFYKDDVAVDIYEKFEKALESIIYDTYKYRKA